MATRLDRFRQFIAALDPSGDPSAAIQRGQYVPRPGGSVAEEMAGRLELQPGSTHLLMGGIGSGKTTELLMVANRLVQLDGTKIYFVDVSTFQQLDQFRAETLIVLAGLTLSNANKYDQRPMVKTAMRQFTRWAYGYSRPIHDENDHYWPEAEENPPSEYIPGILQPPTGGEITEKTFALQQIANAIRAHHPHIVLLFDSLDRLSDPELFGKVVESDLRAIASCGIGVAIVGPLPLLYGVHRSIAGNFDYEYLQTWADAADAQARQFLIEVLQKRVPAELLPHPACESIARWSGGALRDLISIAQTSIQEAYIAGTDGVELRHVERAADRHGRALIRGLVEDELTALQLLRSKGVFVPTSDRDYALLTTRRVFEYRSGSARYAVHPTLVPLLQQLAGVP